MSSFQEPNALLIIGDGNSVCVRSGEEEEEKEAEERRGCSLSTRGGTMLRWAEVRERSTEMWRSEDL